MLPTLVERVAPRAPFPRWVYRRITSLEHLGDGAKGCGRIGWKTSFKRIVYSNLVCGWNDLRRPVQREAGITDGANQRATVDFTSDYDVIGI
ncbi:MAG TPA: hypothetical protein VE596_09735 [Gaiellaceae bacterium]|nr:hypothetical protein [Gaiellaceae bacterium]